MLYLSKIYLFGGEYNIMLIIDRFEGNYAVCEKEDRTIINIERSELPKEAKEGDVLVVKENCIIIDEKATQERREHIKKLMKDLWK